MQFSFNKNDPIISKLLEYSDNNEILLENALFDIFEKGRKESKSSVSMKEITERIDELRSEYCKKLVNFK